MAVDWIRMRTDLYRDPKVVMIADHLSRSGGLLDRYVSQQMQCDMAITRNALRCATVGALVTVWGVTRHNGKRNTDDLIVRGARLTVVDEIADLPGFGEAMASVGWVRETKEGLVFPNFFEEFNSDPTSVTRSSAAERQRRYRERQRGNRDVTRDVTRDAREEKRRVEKNKKKTPLPPSLPDVLNTPEFCAAWESWQKHRREIKKPLTPEQAGKQLQQFVLWGASRSVAAINHTITKGWQGIREPDVDQGNGRSKTQGRANAALEAMRNADSK